MGVKYCKLTFGWVEQIYGDDGRVISQKFVPMESTAVERKLIAPDTEDDDAPIEDVLAVDELTRIEQTERHCDMDMVQPVPGRS